MQPTPAEYSSQDITVSSPFPVAYGNPSYAPWAPTNNEYYQPSDQQISYPSASEPTSLAEGA
jgi:hypothetical protein